MSPHFPASQPPCWLLVSHCLAPLPPSPNLLHLSVPSPPGSPSLFLLARSDPFLLRMKTACPCSLPCGTDANIMSLSPLLSRVSRSVLFPTPLPERELLGGLILISVCGHRTWHRVDMHCCCCCCCVASVVSDSVRPQRRQPTRLPRPWDFPGKNTGVGCLFLLQCMKVKSESEVAQSCLTLSDPMDCSPPHSSIHGIFQARVLEWVAIALLQGHTLKD